MNIKEHILRRLFIHVEHVEENFRSVQTFTSTRSSVEKSPSNGTRIRTHMWKILQFTCLHLWGSPSLVEKVVRMTWRAMTSSSTQPLTAAGSQKGAQSAGRPFHTTLILSSSQKSIPHRSSLSAATVEKPFRRPPLSSTT